MYTRQSVKRPGDDPAVTSCGLQRALCTEFIRNKTWEFWYPITERFDDEGESGATLERPGLAKLLRRMEDGDIHRVIVCRVDRLTQKLADLARLAELFAQHHIGLTIVSGHIDADAGSLAGLQVNMLATFAEWEREIIRGRIADTHGAIRARGDRSAGRVPLGYRADPATKQLVIDEGAAAAVRWFFSEAAKGTTTNDLVKNANRKKLVGKNWSSRTVLRLLTNPTYAGHRPDGAPGRHAPIVSAELFSKVQALIDGRRTRAPTKPSERDADEQEALELFDPFLLRGLITCGTCETTKSPSMSEALTMKFVKGVFNWSSQHQNIRQRTEESGEACWFASEAWMQRREPTSGGVGGRGSRSVILAELLRSRRARYSCSWPRPVVFLRRRGNEEVAGSRSRSARRSRGGSARASRSDPSQPV